MKLNSTVAALSLSLALAAPLFAQATNEQARKETKAELKQQHKSDKAQAKADKAEAKAVDTKQAKKGSQGTGQGQRDSATVAIRVCGKLIR